MTYEYTPPVYKNVNQTAQIGDLVRITQGFWGEDNSEYKGQLAVIEYTYKSKYNGGEREEHQLGISTQSGGGSAWWNASAFEFIEHNRLDIIEVWKKQKIAKQRRLKNYSFLAKHAIGKKDMIGLPGPCISFLWEQLQPNQSMWGGRGEGFTAFQNQMAVWRIWIAICSSFGQPVTKRNWQKFRKHLVNRINDLKRHLEENQNG